MSQNNYGPAAWRAAANDARARSESRVTLSAGPDIGWRDVWRALAGLPLALLRAPGRTVRNLHRAPAAAVTLAVGLVRGTFTMLGVGGRIGLGILGITLALLLPLPAFLFGYGTAGYWVADDARWLAGLAGFACAALAMGVSWGIYHFTYGRYHEIGRAHV